jgi:hypothetical protein
LIVFGAALHIIIWINQFFSFIAFTSLKRGIRQAYNLSIIPIVIISVWIVCGITTYGPYTLVSGASTAHYTAATANPTGSLSWTREHAIALISLLKNNIQVIVVIVNTTREKITIS